ncbi:M23 family metallopeptidase [Chamaesiphon sp. OTE_8_metabat_110]|uniref:M23 family metallopeptidase n=1 Tax=Chamaesiphon sp. OTE_8_metabat_110 TaxID=2964696 RepID=UPI00286CD69A|nr:M23 family metallopeptidase [Chamaesiphon sp. OTE_8_metabat_110]
MKITTSHLPFLQQLARSPYNWRSILLSAFTLAIVLWSAVGANGAPSGTKVSPTSPRLGETLVIDISAQTPTTTTKAAVPTVKLGSKTYPVFGVGKDRFRAMIPTTPLEKPGTREVTIANNTGSTIVKIPVADRKFPIQRINFAPGKAGIEATALELKQVAALKATVSSVKYWDGKFIAPNQGKTSSPYGVKRYYNGEFAKDYYHRGLDYAGGLGSPVVAPAAGKVVLVGYEKKGFRVHGNVVGVDHGQGLTSIFMHLSKISVEEGQMLAAGDQLGAIGSTGSSTGPHLHWGLYVNAVSVDPVQWRSTAIE